jgi:hypothetical protein
MFQVATPGGAMQTDRRLFRLTARLILFRTRCHSAGSCLILYFVLASLAQVGKDSSFEPEIEFFAC